MDAFLQSRGQHKTIIAPDLCIASLYRSLDILNFIVDIIGPAVNNVNSQMRSLTSSVAASITKQA